jgi:hypothetical protein
MLAEVVVAVLLLCPRTIVARTGRMMYERILAIFLWSEGLGVKKEGMVEKVMLLVKERVGGLKEIYLYVFPLVMRCLISLASPYDTRSRIHYTQSMIPLQMGRPYHCSATDIYRRSAAFSRSPDGLAAQ